MAQYKICLDAGHGGSDPGATGNGLREKDINLTICNMVLERLQHHPELFVFRTRGDDRFMSLRMRCAIANDNNADLFISFHSNAGGGSGFESYVCPGAHQAAVAQRIIHQEAYRFMQGYGVKESLPLTVSREDWMTLKGSDLDTLLASVDDRGQKAAHFFVLLYTNMPAILVETLFVDHPEDAQLLKDQKFLEGVARNYAEGIVKFFGLAHSDTELLEQELSECKQAYQQLKLNHEGACEDLRAIAQRSKRYLKK